MALPADPVAALLTLRAPLSGVVEEACARAGVPACTLDGATPPAAPPALVVAELRAGDRRVPQRVLDAAGGTARLLLLCAEPLSRPHVTGQRGRVVMLSPPHTAARLAARIQVLLPGARPQAGALRREERLGERCWACAFSPAGPPRIALHAAPAGGSTALLPPPGEAPDPELLARVAERLAREEPDEARRAGVAQLAGAAAVLHLSAAADRWLLHWPNPAWPLWLHSPQRLPARAELGPRAAHGRTFSMLAAPGDLLLAWAGAPVTGPAAAALWDAAEDGGPAAVDWLAASAGAVPPTGLAVEVR